MIAIKSPSEEEICPVEVAGYAGVPRYRKRHPHASIESRIIDTPQSAINLDSGLVRPSESRMCSWCLDNGHPALEWSLSKGTKKSLVAKARGDGLYRCERCEAINTHLTKIRPRPADYGFSRKDTPSSTPRSLPGCISNPICRCAGDCHR